MAQHLLVVEGAHDAAFFGRLLATRGFELTTNLVDVPEFWAPAIPRKYPVRPDLRLERVISFPEIHRRDQDGETCGIAVANGDGGLLTSLRNWLDVFEAQNFASVGVVLDTDWELTEAARFAAFKALLGPWNDKGVADHRPGFPLAFPDQPNTVRAGAPRLGLYQFPGGGAQGALETVLLACAQLNHPVLHEGAGELIAQAQAHAAYPLAAEPDPLKASRKPSGLAKANCGIIANVLRPGSSLAVSIRDTNWLPDAEAALPAVARAAAFIDALLNG